MQRPGRPAGAGIAGDPRPLPEWDDLGGVFNEGARLIGVCIVYALPFVVVALMLIVPMVIVESSNSEGAQLAFMGCLSCLFLPLTFAWFLFLPALSKT